ncbi:acetylornithine deacetylase [Oleiphilus messinensis]|uniref:Acetylornithine deacetylase n=1 Tax=Oleiphilus messinensis TaxID=141451 RepID=A0A1Y0IEF9_9GAMM|nr:hypothetical protein [Oleiphilus messinensis]ARU58559.1 acetylornithine deacetylase [Oleiphilus messinensis]
MGFLKKLFATLILAAIVVFGAFKGGMWYLVSQQLNQMKEAFTPYGVINWKWISTSFDGDIVVERLSINSFALKNEIVVQRLQLQFDGIKPMLEFAWGVHQGWYPDELTINAEHVVLQLSPSSFNSLLPNDARFSAFSPFRLYDCGDNEYLTGRQLQAMGYEKLDYNVRLNYVYAPAEGALSARLNVEGAGMGRGLLDVVLDYDADRVRPTTLFAGWPSLKKASLNVKDEGYFRRIGFYCSRISNASEQEFVAGYLQNRLAALQENGVYLSPVFADAWKQYMTQGKALAVGASPTQSFSLDDWNDTEMPLGEKTAEILEHVKIQLLLGGQPLGAELIRIDRDQLNQLDFTPEALEQMRQEALARQAEASKTVYVAKYRGVPVENMDNYANRPVKLQLDDGRLVEGVLVAIEEFRVEVESQVKGGTVSYFIEKKQIESAEIYY